MSAHIPTPTPPTAREAAAQALRAELARLRREHGSIPSSALDAIEDFVASHGLEAELDADAREWNSARLPKGFTYSARAVRAKAPKRIFPVEVA